MINILVRVLLEFFEILKGYSGLFTTPLKPYTNALMFLNERYIRPVKFLLPIPQVLSTFTIWVSAAFLTLSLFRFNDVVIVKILEIPIKAQQIVLFDFELLKRFRFVRYGLVFVNKSKHVFWLSNPDQAGIFESVDWRVWIYKHFELLLIHVLNPYL